MQLRQPCLLSNPAHVCGHDLLALQLHPDWASMVTIAKRYLVKSTASQFMVSSLLVYEEAACSYSLLTAAAAEEVGHAVRMSCCVDMCFCTAKITTVLLHYDCQHFL